MQVKTAIKKIRRKIEIKLLISKYEQKFKRGDCELKYLFFPSKTSEKLLIIFSGFPGEDRPAVYNYISTFKNIDCNKLFILDNFGPDIRGGSYYLGKNKDLYIENAVCLLIKNIMDRIGANKNDIIATGSSKGGFAALYFSFKYEYGAVMAGAPQTLLGNYLSVHGQSYLRYIAGELNESNIEYLNSLLYEAVTINKSRPKVFLHVGKKEHHYSEHIIPFCEHLENTGIEYELDLQDYESHGDVGKFYPTFALSNLNKLL